MHLFKNIFLFYFDFFFADPIRVIILGIILLFVFSFIQFMITAKRKKFFYTLLLAVTPLAFVTIMVLCLLNIIPISSDWGKLHILVVTYGLGVPALASLLGMIFGSLIGYINQKTNIVDKGSK